MHKWSRVLTTWAIGLILAEHKYPKVCQERRKSIKRKSEVYARCEDKKRILRILAFAGTSTGNLKLAW
jgi:hypothetical protein